MDTTNNKWQHRRIRLNLIYRSVVKIKWKHESGTRHQAALITNIRFPQRALGWREEGNNKGSREAGLGDVKTLKEEEAGSKWPCRFSHWFFWTHTAMNHSHRWGTELADWVPFSWPYGTVPWTWLGIYPRGRGSWAGLQGPRWRGTESRRQGSKSTCSNEQLVGWERPAGEKRKRLCPLKRLWKDGRREQRQQI